MLKFARQLLRKPQIQVHVPAPIPRDEDDSSIYEPEVALEPDFVLGEQTSVIGKIAFQGTAVIHGLFEGEFEGGRHLIVGSQGFVKADINVDEAEISGKIEGNITVKTRLILKGTAEIRGNITAPRISVGEGVSIIGQVHVTPLGSPDLHTPF
ncbi:MAG: polymer-forming cytoskeletal protein [Rhabdochlamydiaceae bacterium]|nr:polymer-forming cytoskeletal protein [Rhabdochlamydiaceae bacterium]